MSKRAFHDHFSAQAQDYARFRPDYPPALFDWLARESSRHSLAWDCATGNGQAALSLAEHFNRVVATDASAEQIDSALNSARVEYRVATAEASGLRSSTVDLISVAQAAHWFDQAAFHREADRVLKPGGLLAVWGYGLCSIGPDLDPALHALYADRLGAFWPEQRRHIDRAYRSLTFPYPELTAPAFGLRTSWSRENFLGYLGTWSAVRRYRTARKTDPLNEITELCSRHWAAKENREIRWPLFIRAGRKPD
jgi:ubiquinone/menaquinone biosynthesis C-methylase UbiE